MDQLIGHYRIWVNRSATVGYGLATMGYGSTDWLLGHRRPNQTKPNCRVSPEKKLRNLYSYNLSLLPHAFSKPGVDNKPLFRQNYAW